MNNESVVNSIKNLCKEKEITIGQLEKEVGLSQGLVSKWMNTNPSLDKIIDIADYFHVTLDEVVGRNNSIDDEFLNALKTQTDNNALLWNSFMSEHNSNIIKPQKDNNGLKKIFNEDKYDEISYFSKYRSGYITIYCFCQHNKSISPEELSLYIQADDNSSIVMQDYSLEQLMSLWIKVLKQLSNKAPDDIKAEDLKNNFINEFRKAKTTSRKSITYVLRNEVVESIPHVLEKEGCILYDALTHSILQENSYTGATSDIKKFYNNNKSLLGKIIKADMRDSENLLLLSNTRIMKLGGLTCGKQVGLGGYNTLLYILEDAGFDISDQSVFDNDNFIMYPIK